MKLLYIASPFRAANEEQIQRNIQTAVEIAARMVRLGDGHWAAVVPHLMTADVWRKLGPDAPPDDYWLDATMAMLRRCDAAVFNPNMSAGVQGEYNECLRIGLPALVLRREVTDRQINIWLNSFLREKK